MANNEMTFAIPEEILCLFKKMYPNITKVDCVTSEMTDEMGVFLNLIRNILAPKIYVPTVKHFMKYYGFEYDPVRDWWEK